MGRPFFPNTCPNMCKSPEETGNWYLPYTFAKPHGFKVVDDQPPKDFNKLNKSFADASLEDLESLCSGDKEEIESNEADGEDEESTNHKSNDSKDQGGKEEEFIDENRNGETEEGGRKWKVSKYANGNMTYHPHKASLKTLVAPGIYI